MITLGLDLGQAKDFTALVVIDPGEATPPIYDVKAIQRVPKGTRYTRIVDDVCAIVAHLRRPVVRQAVSPVLGVPVTVEARQDVTLVIDYTGVGRPVFDMFLEAAPDCDLIGVTITSGSVVTREEELGRTVALRVPKRILASVVQVLLQEERLRLPTQLPQTALLETELANFRVTLNERGHDSYGAGDDWRDGNHDDLVLALAVATWYAESRAYVEIW